MDLQEQIDEALIRRDFDDAARLIKLRIARDRARATPPLIMGGQGRTDDDVGRDGAGLIVLTLGAVLFWAVVIVFWAVR